VNTVKEIVYIGKDNSNDIELRNDNVVADITPATRVRIELFSQSDDTLAPIIVDSTLNPTAFDWTTKGAQGILAMALGDILTLPDHYRVRLVIYDAVSPGGLVVTHEVTTGCDGSAFELQTVAAADGA